MLKKVKLFLFLFSVLSSLIHAKGTESGTVVQNSAQIIYRVGGMEHNLTTNTDSFLVDQVIDLEISWQDTAAVEVSAGEGNRVLTFLLSNLGNGEDQFTLTYEHNSTDSFSPAPTHPTLYADSNGNGIFDLAEDSQVSDINLTVDANITLFVVSDIPDVNYTSGDLSHDGILAVSQSSATPGADDQHAVDVVVRSDSDRDQGAYVIRDYWLASHKSAVVYSDDNQTHTGTRITYTIDLFIGGNAAGRSIDHVVVSDTIPHGTVYLPSSLQLNDISLTDSLDADAGHYDGTKIIVDVGQLSDTIHQVVRFDVQVQ